MQGEYYSFNQGPYQGVPYGGFPPFQNCQFPIGTTIPSHRNVDNLKRNKYRYPDGRRNEESANSTDESIHLVRSRKGSAAANKSGSETPQKRSQSGNSVGKSPATSESHHESQRNRSKSVERQESKSPGSRSENKSRSASKNRQSSEHVKGCKNKKKKERKSSKGGIWHFSDVDSSQYIDDGQVEHIYLQNSNNSNIIQTQLGGCQGAMPMMPQQSYGGCDSYYQPQYQQQCNTQQQQPYYQDYQQQQFQPQGEPYYTGYIQQPQPTYQPYGAPGGPIDYCQPQQQYQQPTCDYTQSQGGYAVDQGYSDIPYGPGVKVGPLQDVGPIDNYQTQSYGQNQSSEYAAGVPGLPPGAKIVAEYFLGYLDDQQIQQQQQQQQQQQHQQQVTESHSSNNDVVIEVWEKSKKENKSPSEHYHEHHQYEPQEPHHHHHHHHQQQQPDQYVEQQDVIRVDSPIVRRETPRERQQSERKRDSPRKERARTENRNGGGICDSDDLKRLKDDIINSIQKELGNLKLTPGGKGEAIQPIFLMPKGDAAQPKPIYIPRNIYVPVIRPVFVPRERIIVRPQIIHVARPVLVDRPVPIQQRPIVIERDRPVPVRVETVDRNGGGGGDGERNIQSGQEVTYHEFTQSYPSAANEQQQQQFGGYTSSNYQYGGDSGGGQQDMHDNMHHKNMESRSNEDLASGHYKLNDENISKIDSILGGNSQGYTLEVLDQRISEKFVKTDPETIKAKYGVESFQYLPTGSDVGSSQNNRAASSLSQSNEYYMTNANVEQQQGGSASRQGGDLNASGYAYGSSDSQTPYGTITNVAQIPSPGSRTALNANQPVVIQNVQKMIQNFSSYPGDPNNVSSTLIIDNNNQ